MEPWLGPPVESAGPWAGNFGLCLPDSPAPVRSAAQSLYPCPLPPPTPGFTGLGRPMSRPTSVPGLGLRGWFFASSCNFPAVLPTPMARAGSAAAAMPRLALGAVVTPRFWVGVTGSLEPAVVLEVAAVLEDRGTSVEVGSSFFFFQNFQPASTSETEERSGFWVIYIRVYNRIVAECRIAFIQLPYDF